MSGRVPLIFGGGSGKPSLNFVPAMDVERRDLGEILPPDLLRDDLPLPDVPEPEVVRHFVALARKNYGVDDGIYPLGSCTMKYNPRVGEVVARLPGFALAHPLQDGNEGSLELLYELARLLGVITGMDAFTTQPAAGAHGELTGLLIVREYFRSRGEARDKIVVPDSSHGTNPASASMAGFSTVELESTATGEVPLDHLEYALEGGDVAAIMLTNPNTLGLFDRNILEITRLVHEHGGLCYYDGANLNPVLGTCRPGDMGFDIVHLNLHKSFATPHGGGGPGAGPVGVKEHLAEFLPEPCLLATESGPACRQGTEASIGRVRSFWGNFGVLVRAYAYIRALGGDGLRRAGEAAVLNANYLRAKLEGAYDLPYDRTCQHEFVLSDRGLPNGVTTEDVAKRILDHGVHAPTIYFPLIVHGAMMVEPTETESKQTLDEFAEILLKIREEAEESPETLKSAPHDTPVGRLDATLAARKPVLRE
ncbi:MAG: aminomethyl-transferring glycine dehydrogenase subunit GcvPB [Promethearchaeota archaeon]